MSYDVEKFASAVISLLNDRQLYEALRKSGIERSRAMTWTRLLNREVNLILARQGNHANAG